MNELERKIARYRSRPSFYVERGKEWAFDEVICGPFPAGESLAAHGVIELAKQKLLDRVLFCVCGKWVFRRFAHQRSCSATCRHKLYEQSDEYKENRRKYIADSYRLKITQRALHEAHWPPHPPHLD